MSRGISPAGGAFGRELHGSGLPERRRPNLWATAGALFAAAFLLNLLWEIAQMGLFEWWGASWAAGILICARASAGDGLLTLALFGGGFALFRRREWILKPGLLGYLYLAVSGMTLASAIELHALAWDRWAYNGLMPLVPLLGVGVAPVAQMMVLPALSARLARRWLL